MRIVVDTNVLVSGLLRAGGPPVDVLTRPEFDFPPERVHNLLDFLWREGENVRPEALALSGRRPV